MGLAAKNVFTLYLARHVRTAKRFTVMVVEAISGGFLHFFIITDTNSLVCDQCMSSGERSKHVP